MSQSDALIAATDAELAAIFTYGTSTAFVGSGERNTVTEYIAEHRVRRDQLNTMVVASGEQERVPAAGYALTTDITDAGSAQKALLAAEESCATAYLALVEQADDPNVRRNGVDGLSECALRIAHWREVAGITPVTVPFPGR
ncbi:ferritin-like domain-containing protein [Gordonia zhaorongruii]|uniref:ferritin-like domain-containing protein n=1 Tax=Gordonia zhaorongruii TaxID=2597659 RepID=UPI001180A980|nr:ferritin-like domain-containing protein [Gordonia zhaorongruii]